MADDGVLRGRLREPDHVLSNVVRVFISSTFTDTKLERNALLEFALPPLREEARRLGLEFQISEMRWGVSGVLSARHETTALCLAEIEACRQTSASVHFVSLLAQKYGFRPFPAVLPDTLLDQLVGVIPDPSDKALVARWFLRDDNAVPPQCVLAPITVHYPHYADASPGAPPLSAASQAARDAWWQDFTRLQVVLRTAAQDPAARLSTEYRRLFVESVTAAETRLGLSADPAPGGSSLPVDQRCVWFFRKFSQPPGDLLRVHGAEGVRDFVDVSNGQVDAEAQALLRQLEETDMPAAGLTRVHRYDVVSFAPRVGLDLLAVPAHKAYLEKFVGDFVTEMRTSLHTVAERLAQADLDPLYVEAVAHARECREQETDFVGRTAELQAVAGYLETASAGNLSPFVLHGETGVGKSAVLGMAALQTSDTRPHCNVVVRFLGTTAHSSTGPRLLGNLCQHLDRLYPAVSVAAEPKAATGRRFLGSIFKKAQKSVGASTDDTAGSVVLSDGTVLPEAFDDRAKLFTGLLSRATTAAPLVLVLAGLDRLRSSSDARKLQWLPKKLPPHVHILVSTLPDTPQKHFGCFSALKNTVPESNRLLLVPFSSENAQSGPCAAFLNVHLALHKRTLAPAQFQYVLAAAAQCPLPLYLTLAASRAATWTSTAGDAPEFLPPTVEGMIHALFDRLEHDHGVTFVQRALGYLTAARFGLSLQELEDVLSCDEDVLETVYVWWTPPVRRCPPMMLAQLQSKLAEYLVVRGTISSSAGSGVLAWRHRQFTEVARARYVKPREKLLHNALADYFAGRWVDTPLPTKLEAAVSTKAGASSGRGGNRGLGPQPMMFSENPPLPNFRKLDELLYHLYKADRPLDCLQAIRDFDYLRAKKIAFGRAEADSDLDFLKALECGADDAIKKGVKFLDSLRKPTEVLAKLTRQLSTTAEKTVALAQKSLLSIGSQNAGAAPSAVALELRSEHCKAWTQSGQARAVAVSSDQLHLAVASDNGLVTVWNASSWNLEFSASKMGSPVRSVVFSPSGDLLFVGTLQNEISVFNVSTWGKLALVEAGTPGECLDCRAGPVCDLAVGTNAAKKVFLFRKADDAGCVWTPLPSLPQACKVAAVKFARAGELFVSADTLGAIHVFDAAAEYTPLRSLSGVQLCCGLAFFGDSSMAVIVGSSEHALALDVAGNTFSETMKLPGEACAVAVSFDGRLVAVGLSNGSTVVLAADTNTIVAAFSSHAGCVFAVAFLGADRIVTCGEDQIVQIRTLPEPSKALAASGSKKAKTGTDLKAGKCAQS